MLRVEIEWHDTGLALKEDAGWLSMETLKELDTDTVMTMGYLVLEGESDYIIAQSYDEKNGKYLNIQVIAKPAIRKMTVLRSRKDKQ